MDTLHPMVYFLLAMVCLGVLSRLAYVLVAPMAREAWSDVRHGAIGVVSLASVALVALAWLGLALAVVVGAVRAMAAML